MLRQFIFNSDTEAADFVQDVMMQVGGAGRRRNNSGMSISRINESAIAHGGTPWYRTHHERETFLHNRLQVIYEQDREYLYERVPLAKSLCKKVARDCWFRPPTTGDKTIDAFLSAIRGLGFNRAAIAADARQRRSGYSFIYINANGSPSESIENAGDWHGFDVITPDMVDWTKTKMADNKDDPLLAAGIFSLYLKPNPADMAAGVNEGFVIHGSRLIALSEDEDARHIARSRSMLDVIHDSLWDLLDTQFSRNSAQVSGNPLVIELDTQAVSDIDDEEAQSVMDMAVEVRSGARDAFGPIKGLTMKRVGKTDLDDPEWGLRMTVGAISAVTEFSANQIMPFSRGSAQMTPEDDVEYMSRIMVREEIHMLPVYQRLVRLAKASRFAPRRMADLPIEVKWPYMRYITPKETVFLLKGRAQALAQAASAGRRLPEGEDDFFPEDDELRKAMLAVQTVSDIKPRSIAQAMEALELELRAEAFGEGEA